MSFLLSQVAIIVPSQDFHFHSPYAGHIIINMSPSPFADKPYQDSTMEDRESKRRRSAPPPLDLTAAMYFKPETNINIVEDGDVLLVVRQGDAQPVGIRCSSIALSMASPVFKAVLATPATPHPPATDSAASPMTGRLVPLPDDDGSAILTLCYAFHFRSDLLPTSTTSHALLELGQTALKYQCVHAISRTTSQWFDRIFELNQAADLLKTIHAAYLLDEPVFFARFTSRYIKTSPRGQKPPTPAQALPTITTALYVRQLDAASAVRLHVDILVDPCAIALGKESHHYIDCPPDTEPDELPVLPSGEPGKPVVCVVDSQGAPIYLGALRDVGIWPTLAWGAKTIGELIQATTALSTPDYDDCDRCDFCQPLTDTFAEKLALVKKLQAERLWGLCLDCFRAGGINLGECRYPHVKAPVAQS
jgi:hypothetical protein